ncbi:hypothetical protein E2C01_052775 [Portunus trituberculatus]|uniref:Uncharacterized protein n=1 Tax=Portunus trituberculatus TaxID=210409 RepID=A0A5B7GMR0_PORTR|nr:hypothetical protein [Portunus trituberculatus]
MACIADEIVGLIVVLIIRTDLDLHIDNSWVIPSTGEEHASGPGMLLGVDSRLYRCETMVDEYLLIYSGKYSLSSPLTVI